MVEELFMLKQENSFVMFNSKNLNTKFNSTGLKSIERNFQPSLPCNKRKQSFYVSTCFVACVVK